MDLRWRLQGPASQDHPTFQVGHRALFLCPLGSRQHDVGKRGGEQRIETGIFIRESGARGGSGDASHFYHLRFLM